MAAVVLSVAKIVTQPLLLRAAFLGLIAQAWIGLVPRVTAARECRVSWPEVSYLQGARLRPEADGMRTLVQIVRQHADPGDRVLLLPGDPNVEEWWERPRPALSSAIIFTDQYWPGLVDGDFRKLEAEPPKLIVIGPRRFWREFSHVWVGADAQLIDRVSAELLPARYERIASQPIQHAGLTDFMDVYALR